MIDDFFRKLKESLEEHSADLKGGAAFLPKYLKEKKFTKIFPKVAQTLSKKLNLELD